MGRGEGGARRVALVTRGGNWGRFGEECADERKKDFKRFSFFGGGLFEKPRTRREIGALRDAHHQRFGRARVEDAPVSFFIYMFFLDRMADEEYEILLFKQINTLNSQLSW